MEGITEFILELLISLPCVLIALTFHEYAHGFVAYKLGDPTAKLLGRLTLNPLKHLDPVGALCMLFARFGWAKAVPVNMTVFKNPKRDMAITALAGPLANLSLGFIGCFLYSLSLRLIPPFYEENFAYYLAVAWISFIYNFVWLNISLAIFNLLPIPPLDGGKIFFSLFPNEQYYKILRLERSIGLIFMIILIADSRLLGGFITSGLSFLVNGVFDGFINFFNLFI